MSVCIVHRDGWAVCDSRSSITNTILPVTTNKAFKTDNYLFAVVGDGVLEQNIRALAENNTEDLVLAAISHHLSESDDSGSIVCVSRKRELIYIDQLGTRCPFENHVDFWVIGSAEDFVHGYLRACVDAGQAITVELAKKAITTAAKFDSSIDDRVKVFGLNV